MINLKGRYAMCDRFGVLPPSFVPGKEDEGLVVTVPISQDGIDGEGTIDVLTMKGRAQFGRDNGQGHPDGWGGMPPGLAREYWSKIVN